MVATELFASGSGSQQSLRGAASRRRLRQLTALRHRQQLVVRPPPPEQERKPATDRVVVEREHARVAGGSSHFDSIKELRILEDGLQEQPHGGVKVVVDRRVVLGGEGL